MGITREQALDCFQSDDLIGIGMEADALRRRLHPEGVVSYTIDSRIDYSGLFQIGGNVDVEPVYKQIAETIAMGSTGIVLHGTVSSTARVEEFEALLIGIKQRFPSLWLHGICASELLRIANNSSLPLRDVIQRLHESGLDSISGDDAGILSESSRHLSGTSACSVEDWIAVHRAAHSLGMRTTAAMVFGAGETIEQRIQHLDLLRGLQEETGGFTAFTPWIFQSPDAALRASGWDEATAVEYLKTLAVSRMYLNNILNVQSDWTTQGLKVLQMGLRFGGNDVGSVLPGSSAGKKGTTEEDLRRIIRGAGFRPVQRDTLYRTMFLN